MAQVESYRMVRRHTDKLGEHYVVVAVSPRGAEKDAHKFKSPFRAKEVADFLSESAAQEL